MQKARSLFGRAWRTSEGYRFLHPWRDGVYGAQVAKSVAEFWTSAGDRADIWSIFQAVPRLWQR
jgi:hypothetical protein